MAKSNNDACACCASPVLIFSCSGGADTGELADQATREMTRQGIGRMFCLAGIGGKVSGIGNPFSLRAIETGTRTPIHAVKVTKN